MNREKQLKIAPEFMYIEYSKYELYDKLHDDFFSVLDALYDAYPELHVKRLGLRYIDNIEIPNENPFDWNNYLRPELYSILNLADDKKTISRAFHVLEFNYGDYLLRFQFGMFNPDHPAPIKKKSYILDHDMYIMKILEKSEIEKTLNLFHDKAITSFEEVIKDDLRKIMEPINE